MLMSRTTPSVPRMRQACPQFDVVFREFSRLTLPSPLPSLSVTGQVRVGAQEVKRVMRLEQGAGDRLLGARPEFVPVVISSRLVQCTQITKAGLCPGLARPLKPTLVRPTTRFDRSAADGPSSLGHLVVVHALGVSGKIVLLLAYYLADLASTFLQEAYLRQNALLMSVAQPVESLFDPGLGFGFVPAVAGASQGPQVLATVPKIQ